MERPTCATCPYWEILYDDTLEDLDIHVEIAANPDLGFGDFDGECKRYPRSGCMTVFPIVRPDETQVITLPGAFRVESAGCPTNGFHWCGEHPDFPAYIASLKQEKMITPPDTPA